VLERDNFAAALASGTVWGPSGFPASNFDPARVFDNATKPDDIVRVLLDLYVPGGVRPEIQSKLTAFLAEGKREEAERRTRIRDTVHAILTMPEFQLA
jgi:hypothetical protein